MKKMFSKIIGAFTILMVCGFGSPINTYADDMNVEFTILPTLEDKEITEINDKIKDIGSEGKKVNEKYKKAADELNLQQQLNSGIMNRNTILDYLAYVIKFLSQLGLVVGVVFIMYAGYKYMVSVFTGGKPSSKAVKNAIIGVIIVIFSYAIMKTLTSIIGLY